VYHAFVAIYLRPFIWSLTDDLAHPPVWQWSHSHCARTTHIQLIINCCFPLVCIYIHTRQSCVVVVASAVVVGRSRRRRCRRRVLRDVYYRLILRHHRRRRASARHPRPNKFVVRARPVIVPNKLRIISVLGRPVFIVRSLLEPLGPSSSPPNKPSI